MNPKKQKSPQISSDQTFILPKTCLFHVCFPDWLQFVVNINERTRPLSQSKRAPPLSWRPFAPTIISGKPLAPQWECAGEVPA